MTRPTHSISRDRSPWLPLLLSSVLLCSSWPCSAGDSHPARPQARSASHQARPQARSASEGDQPPLQRQRPRGQDRRVRKDQITPFWFADNTRFWYRNDLSGGKKEFILVDAVKGIRAPAFDHQKLAVALAKAADIACRADRLPFDCIDFHRGRQGGSL